MPLSASGRISDRITARWRRKSPGELGGARTSVRCSSGESSPLRASGRAFQADRGPRSWPRKNSVFLSWGVPGCRRVQKKEPGTFIAEDAGQIPGGDLLSQDLSSQYHRRCSVSLPGSEWDRVVPPRSGHQRAALIIFRAGTLAVPSCLRCRSLTSARRIHPSFQQKRPQFVHPEPRGRLETSDFERNQAERMISTGKLHALPHFHFRPIDVVVFHDPSGKTHLGRSLALRCFQRLSRPHIATRPCR